MVIHHATIYPATESDNTGWVYITCDPNEQFVNEVRCTQRWEGVTCKNCLRPAASKPKERRTR